MAYLILEDGTKLEGISFGAKTPVAGEVVFSTGMVGYPESMTDPSFAGQILVFTYPLIGNYGIPPPDTWESEKIQTTGIIVSQCIDTPSHPSSKQTLAAWLKAHNVPGLEIKDTRFLAKKIREQGSLLGKIVFEKDIPFSDPNTENLVAQVSTKKVIRVGNGKKIVVLMDCGTKRNIQRSLLARNVTLVTVPWDYDVFKHNVYFDALVVSNGPGDPKMVPQAIDIVKTALENKIPTFGICLGNQLLTLAAGGDTYKLKFGHRGQNQPSLLAASKRCYLTTQNHGFAVGDIPSGFKPWFINANDNTNEGIIHTKHPFFSVQFHPEATPGPTDTTWLFDYFLERV